MTRARILIVEDEGIVAKDIQNRLTRFGYTVVGVVETGAEAVRLSGEAQPDLVLMDIHLKGPMDGVEAAEQIRANWQIPVVYLTAYADDATLRRARVTEPFGYILKPFEERELPTILEMALYKHAAERRLRASERRYATTLSSIGDGVIATDAEGRITFLNPVAEALTGWSAAETAGQPLAEVFRTLDEHSRAVLDAPFNREGAADSHASALLVSRDGRERPIDGRAAPIHDDEGKCTGAVVVFRDISEKRRLEEQLLHARRMEGIGRLAGGVAHDFNNLLTVILGYCNLLMHSSDADHPWFNMIAEMHKAGERAANLTHQLLAFSRKQLLQPKIVDLNKIVANMETMLGRLIGTHIRMNTVLAADPLSVRADPGQIEQVILNLVVNARDAMPRGGELILRTGSANYEANQLRPLPDMPPGHYHFFSVSDTGTGMDEAVQSRLFEPFFTTKETGKGTGMGLATVFGIVKQSDGHIQVASEVGQGSTFTIWLPARREELPKEPSAVPASHLPRGTETVLLVEDEEAVRALVRQILQSCGYTLVEARNGVEALRLAEQYGGPIHLLLTDVVMPHMAGDELAERIRPVRPGLTVLFLSAFTDKRPVVPESSGGHSDFLHKPFAPEALAKKVRELLDKHSTSAESTGGLIPASEEGERPRKI